LLKIMKLFIFALLCFQYVYTRASDRAVLVSNTMKAIDGVKGKLHLELIRVWGGDNEEDENKFFNTPSSVAIDGNNWVYISDWHDHCIKVFDNSGRYLRTLGRKGQGPGDLYGPKQIVITPERDLLVFESGGLRFQWFSSEGKSKQILKYKNTVDWMSVTAGNSIALYDSYKSFMHKTLISIIDKNGKVLKEFGRYNDKAKNYIDAESLKFSIDQYNNIYAANMGVPVIRKYTPEGKLQLVITFETPLEIPVEIALNSKGDEIERIEEIEQDEEPKITKNEYGVSIQSNKGNKKKRHGICLALGPDSQNRIYVVTRRRNLTNIEESGTYVYGSVSRLHRDKVNYDIVENIDVNQLLVFDSTGKIIAQAPMTTFCDNLYIYNDRVFVIDGFLNQRIMEYRVRFEK
jgi:hypothetical protein